MTSEQKRNLRLYRYCRHCGCIVADIVAAYDGGRFDSLVYRENMGTITRGRGYECKDCQSGMIKGGDPIARKARRIRTGRTSIAAVEIIAGKRIVRKGSNV